MIWSHLKLLDKKPKLFGFFFLLEGELIMKARCSMEVLIGRIKKTVEMKTEYLNKLKTEGRYHIACQPGNSKTGKNCRTISLISGHDCQHCKECFPYCYDLNNVMWQPVVQNDRARNSALHTFNIDWYWEDVEADIKENFTQEQRINIGGDSTYDDFVHITAIAERNPKCDILVFTKNYTDLNRFLDERNGEYPSNLHIMWSRWCGMESDNKWNIPEAHVLFENGTTTAPEFGSVYCGGNCSECHFNENGCWSLKKGESVIFNAH